MKIKNEEKLKSLYNKELKILEKSEKILANEEIDKKALKEGYQELANYYGKLIKSAGKITRIGDMYQKRLLDANEQIQKQKEELEDLNSELRELNATKDTFFSIIAHDLKNPLAAFLSISQLMTDHFDSFSHEELEDIIANINTSAKHLSNLLENLLQWSRSQTGRIKFNPRGLDLSIIISDTLHLLAQSADKKNVALATSVDDHTLVYADENMLCTVIRNLISNAIKFTHPGGKVAVSVKHDGTDCVICVSDTGIGISEENIRKLFRIDIHHTTLGTKEEKGTGLGLILCKEFIETNKGKIWVESEIEKGSSFKFTIPKSDAIDPIA